MQKEKFNLKFTILLMFFITFFCLADNAYASTQQYAKIYLEPYYRNSMTSGVNYNYTLNVNPPDGISRVVTAIIYMEVWITPSINFSIWVNNIPCKTPFYYISTTYATSGLAKISFDCSNVINSTGNYTVTIRPSLANTGASTIWLELTYFNDPKFPKLSVFGTEYLPNTKGKIFLQYLDMYGNPINNALCLLDIFKPDNTVYMKNVVMNYIPGSSGLYAYDLITPSEEGVYPLSAYCVSPSAYTQYVANNFSLYSGSVTGGSLGYTWDLDGLTHNIKCPFNASYIFRYDFENASRISFDWYGRVTGGSGTVYFRIFNCTSRTYSTILSPSLSADVWYHFSREVPFKDAVCNNTVEINIYMTVTPPTFQTDYIFIRLWNVSEEQSIRGGGELHVWNISHIMDKLDMVNKSIIDAIEKHNVTIYEFLVAMNNSNSEMLREIANNLLSLNNTLTYYFLELNATNFKNYQDLINFLELLNQTNHQYYESIIDKLSQVNISLYDFLYYMNQSYDEKVRNISSLLLSSKELLEEINDRSISILDYLYALNQTNKVYYENILAYLIGINESFINSLNQHSISVFSMLELLNQTNQNLYESLLNEITSGKESIISLLESHNASIMDFLYAMNQSNSAYFENLANMLFNVTNITFNITLGTEELYYRLRNFIISYFSTDVTNQTCINSNTLRVFREITYNITDERGRPETIVVSKFQDINCPYGCENNECKQPPYILYGILLGIVVFFIIIYFIFR